MSDFDDLYEVIIVNLKAPVYKADREYFNTHLEATQFVTSFNEKQNQIGMVTAEKAFFAKYNGRVT